MSLDFNKKGQVNKFEAFANAKSNLDVLNEKSLPYFSEIQALISKIHNDGDAIKRRLMVSAQGCLERLEAFLVQTQRIIQHNKSISNQAAPEPGSMIAFRDTTAIFDFETLLFHSRALLDRITFFIAKQIYNQDCDRPNKLKNVLNNFKEKDPKAARATEILDETMPTFQGLIVDAEGGVKSLRSHLIHKSTSGENTTCSFTIHSAPGNKVIRFDYEIKSYPLIGSAWILSKYIPYFSLSLLGIYLGNNKLLSLEDFTPIWENNLKCFSKYIDDSANGQPFSIIKMNPSGFELQTRKLKPSVLS